ncbi:calcium permeable stress-gated cation channel [Nematocida sp. AWRm80]|nr:calcium permeable stress-gated cation channel [Nematocida sp. AWRm80]
MFYRKYVILRQLHLRDRSFSKSTSSIKRKADMARSVSKALSDIELPAKTVFIRNLPEFINGKDDLIEYLKLLGVGVNPVDAHVIINTKRLKSLVEKRKEAIFMLERELQLFFVTLNSLSIESDFFSKHVKDYDASMDLISNAIAWSKTVQEPVEDQKTKEMRELVEASLEKPFLSVLQKINPGISPSNISARLEEIKALNASIDQERETNKKTITTQAPLEESQMKSMIDTPKLHDVYDLDKEDPIFFSVRTLFYPYNLYKSFKQTIPLNARNGFVTMAKIEEANFLKMTFMGTGVFSCKALDAPPPDEIIWDNLTESDTTRLLKKIIGNIITVLFVCLFIGIVFMVSVLINMETFDKLVLKINPELQSITETPRFRNTFQGIVAPLVYSTFLSLAPMFLEMISMFEGSISLVSLQKSFGRKYSFFLFINGFLALMFSTTVISILQKDSDSVSLLAKISKPVVMSSVFFLNTLIQKSFTGLCLFLLEPNRILFKAFSYLLGGICTRREEVESIEPNRINFGYLYPQVFLVFPMIMIYAIISPVFILFGAIHFFGAFIVFKSLFLYSHVSDLESGGEHWPLLCSIIFYSMMTFQTVTIIHFVSIKQYLAIVLLLPLLLITYLLSKHFLSTMKKRCNYLPSSRHEQEKGSKFVHKLSITRKEEIKHWKESPMVEMDMILLSKRISPSHDEMPYLYKDLSLHPDSSFTILPNWFYVTLRYLKTNGDSSVFRL